MIRLGKAIYEAGVRWVESKGVGSSVTLVNTATNPQYSPAGYYTYAKEGYEENDLIRRGIDFVGVSIAEAPLTVYTDKDDTAIPNHPLDLLLQNPNPHTSENDFLADINLDLYLGGNAYLEKVKSLSGNKVLELWRMRPDRIEIVPSVETYIEHYIYNHNGKKTVIPVDNIIHIRLRNPLVEYFGLPILLSAAHQVDTDNEATDFTNVMLKNRGVAPGFVLTSQGKVNDAQRKTIGSDWNSQYSGDNRGKLMILEGTQGLASVSLNMHELALTDMRKLNMTRVLLSLGVPPILLGIDDATFANYAEARRSFYEDTISPYQTLIVNALNAGLVKDFGGGIHIGFDISDVPALRGIRAERRKAAQEGFTTGLLTLNEARAEAGKPQTTDGDMFLRPMNLVPTPATVKKSACGCGVKHKDTVIGDGLDRWRVGAVARRDAAELWIDPMEEWARKTFWKFATDTMKIVKEAKAEQLTRAQVNEITDGLPELQILWSALAFETVRALLGEMLAESATAAGVEIGIAFDLSSAAQQVFIRDYGFKFADKISKTSVDEIRKVVMRSFKGELTYNEMVASLRSKFTKWSVARANSVARTEVIRAGNAGAVEAWRSEGIPFKEWVVAGDACPYCLSLAGKKIPLDDNFLSVGESLVPNDVDPPLVNNYEDVGVPPVHTNCMCTLIPVFE